MTIEEYKIAAKKLRFISIEIIAQTAINNLKCAKTFEDILRYGFQMQISLDKWQPRRLFPKYKLGGIVSKSEGVLSLQKPLSYYLKTNKKAIRTNKSLFLDNEGLKQFSEFIKVKNNDRN